MQDSASWKLPILGMLKNLQESHGNPQDYPIVILKIDKIDTIAVKIIFIINH